MKWYVNELNRGISEFHYKYELDLTDKLNQYSDILRIDPVTVKGKFLLLAQDVFEFNYKIETTMYLADAITLKEVPFRVSEWVTDTYTKEGFDGNAFLDQDYLELEEMVYANLLVLKPIRITLANSEDFIDVEEEHINEAFRDLDKYLKGDK